MSNLQPTPIVDKNGKQTTVHKKSGGTVANDRSATVALPRQTRPEWADITGALTQVMRPHPDDMLGRRFVTELGNTGYQLHAVIAEQENGRIPFVNIFSTTANGGIPLHEDDKNVSISLGASTPPALIETVIAATVLHYE